MARVPGVVRLAQRSRELFESGECICKVGVTPAVSVDGHFGVDYGHVGPRECFDGHVRSQRWMVLLGENPAIDVANLCTEADAVKGWVLMSDRVTVCVRVPDSLCRRIVRGRVQLLGMLDPIEDEEYIRRVYHDYLSR